MEAKTHDEMKGCVLLWKIKNVSHCWLKKGEEIKSPPFIAEALISTEWYLSFSCIGNVCGKVDVSLCRERYCSGPDRMNVIYKLALLHKDGSFLKEGKWESGIYRRGIGWILREERSKIFGTRREAFLPDDTLTVHCTIWKIDDEPVKPKELYARTVWNVKRRCFAWKIAKFSTLEPDIRNKFKDDLVEFDFVLNEGLDFEMKLVIDVISFDKSIKYFLLKICVVNSKRKKEHYGNFEYFESDLKKEILSKTLSTRKLIEKKSRYLTNDILSLDCECLYSTGTIADQFCSYGMSVS